MNFNTNKILILLVAPAFFSFACDKAGFTDRGKSKTVIEPSPSPDLNVEQAQVPKFGMLVNDLECSFCHLKVNGDIASTSPVIGLWGDSIGEVVGSWFAAGDHDVSKLNPARPAVGVNVSIKVAGGVKTNYRGDELPNDLNGDGKPDFPIVDFSQADAKMDGEIKTSILTVSKVHNANLVLVGTALDPIQIKGEVLVKGDLVIKGFYKGIGTIYATGNIYIPADLKAENSAFPYPEDRAAAIEQAKAAMLANKDALALATNLSIIVSDYETHDITNNRSVFDHPLTPDGRRFADLKVKNVETWIPGGKAEYDKLYEDSPLTHPNGTDNNRSISLIEAYLYAQNTVGGRANHNSYSLNGGVIADHFHIISGGRDCPEGIHPVHKQNQKWNYVNYDWRLQVGLPLLKLLYPYFTK